MASIKVNGVRINWVRKCKCGRKPEIATGYIGYDDGSGPFFIKCHHGIDDKEFKQKMDSYVNTGKNCPNYAFVRSWSKTRAVKIWNEMQSN